jgi:hypothetical protein
LRLEAASLTDATPYADSMPDDRDDATGEMGDGRSDEAVLDECVEQHDLDELSWIEDGENYRCPECEAVHDEPTDACRGCGWESEERVTPRD